MRCSVLLSLVGGLAVAAAAAEQSSQKTKCYKGAYMIVARQSNAKPGEGMLQPVAQAIQEAIPDSTSVAVVYPAVKVDYESSEQLGVMAAKKMVRDYVMQCSETANIVLMGYSQGAQVIADAIGGSCLSSLNPLKAKYTPYIKAVILMGDPSRINNQPYQVGSATQEGIFKRSTAEKRNLLNYTSIMQSYCDEGDEWCASGPTRGPHLTYVKRYGTAAVDFVVGLMNETIS